MAAEGETLIPEFTIKPREYDPPLRPDSPEYLLFLRRFLFCNVPQTQRNNQWFALMEGAPFIRFMLDAEASYAHHTYNRLDANPYKDSTPISARIAARIKHLHESASFATRMEWALFVLTEVPQNPLDPNVRPARAMYFVDRNHEDHARYYSLCGQRYTHSLSVRCNMHDIYRLVVVRPIVFWTLMQSLQLFPEAPPSNARDQNAGFLRVTRVGAHGSAWRWFQCAYIGSAEGETPWMVMRLRPDDPRYVLHATSLVYEQHLILAEYDHRRIQALCEAFIRENAIWSPAQDERFKSRPYLAQAICKSNTNDAISPCLLVFYLCLEAFAPFTYRLMRDAVSQLPLSLNFLPAQVQRFKDAFPPFFRATAQEMGLEPESPCDPRSHYIHNWTGLPLLYGRRHQRGTIGLYSFRVLTMDGGVLDEMVRRDPLRPIMLRIQPAPAMHLLRAPRQGPPAALFASEMAYDMLQLQESLKTSQRCMPRTRVRKEPVDWYVFHGLIPAKASMTDTQWKDGNDEGDVDADGRKKKSKNDDADPPPHAAHAPAADDAAAVPGHVSMEGGADLFCDRLDAELEVKEDD